MLRRYGRRFRKRRWGRLLNNGETNSPINFEMKRLLSCLAVLVSALILAAIVSHCRVAERINPAALTRYTLETCEELEAKAHKQTEAGLMQDYFDRIQQTDAYKGGYVALDLSTKRILDGWGNPLNVVEKEILTTNQLVSQRLSSKTNRIIIWSSGANGRNEYGGGDDASLPYPSKE